MVLQVGDSAEVPGVVTALSHLVHPALVLISPEIQVVQAATWEGGSHKQGERK